MEYLLRKINRSGSWVGAVASVNNDDFPVGVIAELVGKDVQGVSFWRVPDPNSAQVERICAALAVTGTMKFDKMEFRFFKYESSTLGDIQVVETPGKIIDTGLRDLHVDLHIRTCPQAIRIAKAMLLEPTRNFSVFQVRKIVADAVFQGNFTLKALNQEFVKALYDDGRLSMNSGNEL